MDNNEKLNKEDLGAVAGGYTSDRYFPKYSACSYVYINNPVTGGTIKVYIHDDFWDHDCKYGSPAEWVYNCDGADGTRYVVQEHEILREA